MTLHPATHFRRQACAKLQECHADRANETIERVNRRTVERTSRRTGGAFGQDTQTGQLTDTTAQTQNRIERSSARAVKSGRKRWTRHTRQSVPGKGRVCGAGRGERARECWSGRGYIGGAGERIVAASPPLPEGNLLRGTLLAVVYSAPRQLTLMPIYPIIHLLPGMSEMIFVVR